MRLFCYYKHVNNEDVMFYPTKIGDRSDGVTFYIGWWVNNSKKVLSYDIIEIPSEEEDKWIVKD